MKLYLAFTLAGLCAMVGVATVLAYYWSFIKLYHSVKKGDRVVLLASPKNPKLMEAAATLITGEYELSAIKSLDQPAPTRLSVVKETE